MTKVSDASDLTNQVSDLIEKAKKNKKAFRKLKELGVHLQMFEFSADLRAIEKELFPELEEVKEAKSLADDLNLLFRMVELNVNPDVAWLVHETIKVYKKKKMRFNVDDAARLIAKRKELFDL